MIQERTGRPVGGLWPLDCPRVVFKICTSKARPLNGPNHDYDPHCGGSQVGKYENRRPWRSRGRSYKPTISVNDSAVTKGARVGRALREKGSNLERLSGSDSGQALAFAVVLALATCSSASAPS